MKEEQASSSNRRFDGKTVLVTGGAGFIGSNYFHFLLARYPNIRVVNLDKLTCAGNLDNLADIRRDPRYEFIHCDIHDRELVQNIFEHVQGVFHFAAESHVERSIMDAGEFVQTDVFGAFVLLEALRKDPCGDPCLSIERLRIKRRILGDGQAVLGQAVIAISRAENEPVDAVPFGELENVLRAGEVAPVCGGVSYIVAGGVANDGSKVDDMVDVFKIRLKTVFITDIGFVEGKVGVGHIAEERVPPEQKIVDDGHSMAVI